MKREREENVGDLFDSLASKVRILSRLYREDELCSEDAYELEYAVYKVVRGISKRNGKIRKEIPFYEASRGERRLPHNEEERSPRDVENVDSEETHDDMIKVPRKRKERTKRSFNRVNWDIVIQYYIQTSPDTWNLEGTWKGKEGLLAFLRINQPDGVFENEDYYNAKSTVTRYNNSGKVYKNKYRFRVLLPGDEDVEVDVAEIDENIKNIKSLVLLDSESDPVKLFKTLDKAAEYFHANVKTLQTVYMQDQNLIVDGENMILKSFSRCTKAQREAAMALDE
jgi:hypothetical protein